MKTNQMKVNREKLVRHLQRISCGGQVGEAVFTGTFGTVALIPTHQLLVTAPSLPKTKVLFKKAEPAGIAELPKLMKALSVLAGTGNEAVDVVLEMDGFRLVVDEGERGKLRLMTAKPKTIATFVEEETVKALLAKAPEEKNGIALQRTLLDGIRNTFSLFKATEIELHVGPKGGKVRVGGDNADNAEFESDALKAEEEYILLFGEPLVDVLSVVTNFNEAMLYLGGPNNFILIDDGGYRYILNPNRKSADV